MCVTDYCPHSYSYRMILIRTHFIFISLARFCIWHTVLELTIELVRIFDTNKQESESKWLFSLLFARRKNLISVSSFACWNCPLPQTCLACACTHCRLVFNGMLFLYSLLNLSASLLPSIERQVGLFIVVCSWKSRCPCHPHQQRDKFFRWKNWYPWYHHSLVGTAVRCLKPDQRLSTGMCTVDFSTLQAE